MAKKKVDTFGNELPLGMYFRAPYYYVRSTVNGHRRKKSTDKKDFKSAMRRYHEIMLGWNNQDSGWEAPSEAPTLKAYWLIYRATWVVGTKTPKHGTTDDYRDDSLIAHVLFDLGNKRLGEITPTMAQRWVQKRSHTTYQRQKGGTAYPIAESTVTREVVLLQTLFTKAIEDGHLEKNPWLAIARPNYAIRDRVLSLTEQAKLEEVLAPKLHRLVNFLLGTGLRIQEAIGIRETQDLDLQKAQVRVTRKTRGLKKKTQIIPLFAEGIIEVLQAQLEAEGALWHQTADQYRAHLAKASKKAGIEHISPHTLRHTFATRYLQSGGNIYTLSKLLGHASVSITERIYAHLLTEDLAALSAHVSLGVGVPGKVLPFKKGLTA